MILMYNQLIRFFWFNNPDGGIVFYIYKSLTIWELCKNDFEGVGTCRFLSRS
jgi:hypothetical protein